jgi:hypothetical protein
MKNEELFIDPSEIATLQQADKLLQALLTSVRNLDGGISTFHNTLKRAATNINEISAAEMQLNAFENEANNIINQRVRLQAQLSPLLKAERQDIANLVAERNQENATLRLQANLNAQVAGSFGAAKAQLALLKSQLNGMPMGSPQIKAVAEQINKLNSEILATEASFGQFGRNVGNYGFNPLKNQAMMLANELPNLAISPRIFFQSLSNNLGMFSQAIATESKRIREEIATTGKSSTSILKQIAGAFLSRQTAILVGITLFTKYSDQIAAWIGNLFKGREAALSMADAVGNINKTLGEDKTIGESIANYERLQSVFSSLGNDAQAKEKFISDYREELDRTGLAISNINDAEYIFSSSGESAFRQTVQNRAKILAGMTLASQKYQEALTADMDMRNSSAWSNYFNRSGYQDNLVASQLERRIKSMQENIDRLNAEGDKYIQVVNAISDNTTGLGSLNSNSGPGSSAGNSADLVSRARMQGFRAEQKALEDLTTAETNARIRAIEAVLKADRSSFDERTNLVSELYSLELKRITDNVKVERENLIALSAETGEDITNRLKLIDVAEQAAQIQAAQEWSDALIVIEDDLMQTRVRNVEIFLQERNRSIDEAESTELVALEKKHGGILRNELEYEDERLAITRKYADQRNNAGLEALESQLAELKNDNNRTIAELEKIADLEQEIADYRVEINQEANDRIIEDNERLRERKEKQLQNIVKYAGEAFDLIAQISKISTDKQIGDIEAREKEAESQAEEERDRIERLAEAGAITEEQKNARIALSEQQLEARRKIFDAQRAELERRQAKLDVLLSTAQAIMTAAASAPWPLNLIPIGFATAMGITQLAAVNAARYAEGTPISGHKGGPAIVGDGGRAEMVIVGDKIYRSPSIPTLVNLPAGAQVLPDWNDAIKQASISNIIMKDEKGIINFYDAPSSISYNDRAVTMRQEKQIELTGQLIREMRRNRNFDRITAFKSMKLTGIN